jgi:DNA-binding response OmpR family regulator
MRNGKIAIIDENKKVLEELEEILVLSGYTPVPVVDPLMAVETVIQHKPDVIVMELKLPRKSGFELTHTINGVFETKKVPIIAMSESYRDEFRWLLDFCGIKRWIKKPFQPLNLIWAIENEIVETIPQYN